MDFLQFSYAMVQREGPAAYHPHSAPDRRREALSGGGGRSAAAYSAPHWAAAAVPAFWGGAASAPAHPAYGRPAGPGGSGSEETDAAHLRRPLTAPRSFDRCNPYVRARALALQAPPCAHVRLRALAVL